MTRLALVLLSGCSQITDSFATNEFSGDPYPIQVDTASGALVVGLREGGVPDRVAVLDVLSPITVLDPGLDATPTVSSSTLTVLGKRSDGSLDLPRAQFSDARVVLLHPCADESCQVGTSGVQRPYQAIVGADALAGDALRLRLGDDSISILASVAGDEQARALSCDAVYPSPYRGGGTLVIGGTELGFSGRRITMPACLGANPDPGVPQSARGADALLLMSTSIGPSLLGETAYRRYRLIDPAAPELETLPEDAVFLPSGPVAGRVTTIKNLALVARSSSTPRAACRHVYAHHLLLERNCTIGDDCPCEDGDAFCPLPALVEIAPAAGVEVLVIPDDNSTLQALRAELRPNQPEVDGILGLSALRALEVDIDYPDARVLARCTADDCTMRTALPEESERENVRACLTAKR